ncbi:Hypothetical predicted protein [Olea europaea subsp. europaea]|uniref:TFIIB-type domain-containing protein n=1 Tax=Olea europaea subsp. europaea TaxID=158383 RepID=A0A8S0S769_OLEEU|nr:Hypothetical predicted protein [Olea europaea subsp. europaea]
MNTSRPCKSCRKRTLLPDDVTGNMVCTSCGVVQDFDNFQAHIGGITGPAGTYVRVGTAGTGSAYNCKERLSGSKSHEVKVMVETITTGEYGQGKWFPVFIGACAYVVMRMDKKILPIEEVVDLVGCDVYELGIIRCLIRFGGCGSEDVEARGVFDAMFDQVVLDHGKEAVAVVAAVLVFVGELNQLDLKLEDVAKKLHLSIITCRRRYKELLERLVKVARALPWGEDVTVKNIMKNAPNVIQYMEMKSMSQFG